MKAEYEKVLIDAVMKFGIKAQLEKTKEELFELGVALCHHADGKNSRIDLATEIADVEIMLSQVKKIYGISGDVHNEKIRKIERLKDKLATIK